MSTDATEGTMFLAMLLGWAGGELPVFVDGKPRARTRLSAAHVGRLGVELAALAERLDRVRSAEVAVGLPVDRLGAVRSVTVLWAWAESGDQVRRAHRFRPKPTLVLRMGASCRRLLLWGLREQVPELTAESDNKRIAYALHAPQKYAPPGGLRVPVPGTFLRVDRKKPAPVLVTRAAFDASYTRSQVVAGLREPPPPFMQRVREGDVRLRRGA